MNTPTARGAAQSRPIWPPVVRCGHWLLATGVLGCLWLYQGGPWHERLGYLALAVALWRCAHGLSAQRRHLRFSGFLRGPRGTWAYARALLAHREPRHLGHNPLGAWMIVLLLLATAVAGASGALYATDRYWGDETVYAIHKVTAWSLAVLVPVHLAGVLLTSWLQRENLVLAMFSGRKRAAAADDVDLEP